MSTESVPSETSVPDQELKQESKQDSQQDPVQDPVQAPKYSYEIDPVELETVFNSVISCLGGRGFVCPEGKSRVEGIIDALLGGQIVTGCKYYPTSLKADKTVDETQKTLVISSFPNLKFLGLQNKASAKRVVLSHQMKDKLKSHCDSVIAGCGSSPFAKILILKHPEEGTVVPEFVKKNVTNFVFVKIVIKLPNQVPNQVPAQ
jgi:hypothetical protein